MGGQPQLPLGVRGHGEDARVSFPSLAGPRRERLMVPPRWGTAAVLASIPAAYWGYRGWYCLRTGPQVLGDTQPSPPPAGFPSDRPGLRGLALPLAPRRLGRGCAGPLG